MLIYSLVGSIEDMRNTFVLDNNIKLLYDTTLSYRITDLYLIVRNSTVYYNEILTIL